MGRKKDYLPNNWQEYKDADDDMFIQHSFEEIMSWKVQNWELPASVTCIIRVYDKSKHKVTETVYQRKDAAMRKIATLMDSPNLEFTVVDHESVHHIAPVNPTEDNEND